jgi:hypothetical protein
MKHEDEEDKPNSDFQTGSEGDQSLSTGPTLSASAKPGALTVLRQRFVQFELGTMAHRAGLTRWSIIRLALAIQATDFSPMKTVFPSFKRQFTMTLTGLEHFPTGLEAT